MKPDPSTGRPEVSRLLTDQTDGPAFLAIPAASRISNGLVVVVEAELSGGSVGAVRDSSVGSTASMRALSDDV